MSHFVGQKNSIVKKRRDMILIMRLSQALQNILVLLQVASSVSFLFREDFKAVWANQFSSPLFSKTVG